jgi:hypothetical protein
VEYHLYRSEISRFHPEYVLLYLSEFDVARRPAYSAFRYAPSPRPDFLAYRRLVLGHDPSPEAKRAFAELLGASLFPEYRYSFVHDGLLDRWLNPRAAFGGEAGRARARARPAPGFRLSPEAVPLSLASLKWFLNWCIDSGLKVVIVEGHYAPSAMTPENRALNGLVTHALRSLADPSRGVYFLPRDVTRPLTNADFDDAAHVKDRVGYEIAAAVVARIRSNDLGPP